MTNASEIKTHLFEWAGLGKAPFHVVGYRREVGPKNLGNGQTVGSPGQPMGSCDYCGTGIADCFRIRSADGKEFIVGSTCVGKTGDAGLKKVVRTKVNALKREARHAREAKRIADGREWAEANREIMNKMDHPHGFNGKTLADYYDWMMDHSGNSGRIRAIKTVQAEMGK